MSNQVKIVGIAGGSGSGKTTFARRLREALGDRVGILYQDSYYIDQSKKFDKDGGSVNFDHPAALDWPLMAQHLKDIKAGKTIDVPFYDFATHTRLQKTNPLKPMPVILVDGILIFHPKELKELFDYKIFIDCSEELRFSRRLKRDVEERGRTPQGVKDQFDHHVKPMHDQFVEPSKKLADLVVDQAHFDEKLAQVIAQFTN